MASGSPERVLDHAQIEEFRREGVLLLPDFIDEEQLADWRRQVWRGLGADEDDRSTWPTAGGHAAVDLPEGLTPTPGQLPQFQALMAQLSGGADTFTGGGAQIATIFPNVEPEEWALPSNGHVDGYNNIWSGTG
eukprot:COSAG04_NODE_3529_length_2733_cov_1.957875_3_plen_133_part_01